MRVDSKGLGLCLSLLLLVVKKVLLKLQLLLIVEVLLLHHEVCHLRLRNVLRLDLWFVCSVSLRWRV